MNKVFTALSLNSVWKIIFLALLLRLIIMPFLFHPDIKTHFYHFRFLEKGVVNIYDYIDQNKRSLSYKDTYNYPPLPYFVFGSYFTLVHPLLGNAFDAWMNDWGNEWFTNPEIFRMMFILKIPYLVFDLLIGFLIAKLVSQQLRTRALVLWFFNPITLYIIYGMATFDVIVAFFVLLSLLFFKKSQQFYSGLSLGTAIAFKLFPLLFVPFFVLPFLLKKLDLKAITLFTMGVVLVPLVTILPFFNEVFGTQSSGLMAKFLEYKFPFFNIPIFFVNYAVSLLAFWGLLFRKSNEPKESWELIHFFVALLLLLMLGFTNYHPQWLLWVLPFLLLATVQSGWKLVVFIPLLISYGMHLFSIKDRFITNGIISPIFPFVYDLDSIDQTLFARFSEMTFNAISFWLFIFAIIFFIISRISFGLTNLPKFKLNYDFLKIGLLTFTTLFFVCLIVITTFYHSKKILAVSQTDSKMTVPLLKSTPFSQSFTSPDSISVMYVLIKNPNYRNSDKTQIEIRDTNNQQALTTFNLNGTNIGGEDWVKLKLAPLTNLSQKSLAIHLSTDTENTQNSLELPLSAQNELNYKVYSENSFFGTLKNDLDSFLGRFFKDTLFVFFYSSMIFVTGISLAGVIIYYKKS